MVHNSLESNVHFMFAAFDEGLGKGVSFQSGFLIDLLCLSVCLCEDVYRAGSVLCTYQGSLIFAWYGMYFIIRGLIYVCVCVCVCVSLCACLSPDFAAAWLSP